MDILYLLIPLSAGLVLVILGVFAWATFNGQFDDIEDEGRRILAADADHIDSGQVSEATPEKQSPKHPSLSDPSRTQRSA